MKKILSILLLTFCVCVNAQIGNTNNGTSTDTISQYINVTVAQASSTITSTNLNVKVSNITGRYKFAIYKGSATAPSTFLVGSTELTNPTTGWYSVVIPQTTFTNGQYYWFASWSDSTRAQMYYSPGGTTVWEGAPRTFGTWPNTLAIASGGASFNYCVYASAMPIIITNPPPVIPTNPPPIIPTNPPPTTITTNTLTLKWDTSCDLGVTGYKIYYGTNGNVLYTNIVASHTDACGILQPTKTNIYHTPYTLETPIIEGRTNSTAIISNLFAGATYSFVAVSVQTAGIESDYSNEAQYTVPTNSVPPQPPQIPLPPTVLRFR